MKVVVTDQAAAKARVVMDDGSQHDVSVEGLQPEPKVVRLSEIKRAADGRFDFAALSESQQAIAPEVFRAMAVQQELDGAVKAGKITPAQRPSIEKLALSDLPAFREFIAAQKGQVDLSETGLAGGAGAGGDLARVDAQIEQLARAKVAADKIGYGQAFKAVLSERPDLAKARISGMREEA